MFTLLNFTDGCVEYDSISQIIGYKDGSLELCFKDNSNLQLSPCGANFKYCRSNDKSIPVLAKRSNELSQRCVFATSETRGKVIQAISIRNQLCHRPYVVSDFAEQMGLQPFRLYKELEKFEWPPFVNLTQSVVAETDFSKHSKDGVVTITSKDNFAQLELHPDRHTVQVSYAARLVKDRNIKGHRGAQQQQATDELKGANLMYVWQKRIFPVSQCPEEWKYPLDLALGSQSESKTNLTEAPQSLPRKCPKQFDHKWRQSEYHVSAPDSDFLEGGSSNICFLWCNGDSYWISNSTTSSPKIEVWMSNGNILQSHPTNDRYFVYKFKDLKNEDGLVERIMSSASIPQDPKLKSVFLCSIRLLTYSSPQNASQASIPCWDTPSTDFVYDLQKNTVCVIEKVTLDLREKIIVPNVGTFSVVEDSIQIAFDDRTMLHAFLKTNDSSHGQKIELCQCRLTLQDGQYYVLDDMIHPDPKIVRYAAHASCWVEWLSKPVGERAQQPFYSDTIYDTKKVDMVTNEIQKIQKAINPQVYTHCLSDDFKYLELSGNRRMQCENFQDVTSALSRTNRAIEDLDAMISSFRKNSPP